MKVPALPGSPVAELVRFLRDAGCIAYATGDGEVEVLRPQALPAREPREIAELLEAWMHRSPFDRQLAPSR